MEKKTVGNSCKSFKPESKSSHYLYKQTNLSLETKTEEKN